MKRIIQLSAVLLALGIASGAAKDESEKKSKEERREEKREKAERSEKHSPTPPPMPATPAAHATPTPPPPKEPMSRSEGYEVFRNVRTKNIFDPTRRGPRIETPPTAGSSSSSSRGRSLALTGTMVTEGKALAFFGGSAADGNRVLSVGNSVANYKVTEIEATRVALESNGKSLVLEVGRQISFDGAPGDPGTAGPIVEAAPHSPAETTGLPPPPAGVSGDKAEILRRMMERRAKEGGR